jgi:hypothetical protein
MPTPTTHSAHKAPQNAARAKAVAQEAYVFGLPLGYAEIGNDLLTHVTKPTGDFAPVNRWPHREFPDAKNHLVVGMNVDTLYSFGIIDLSKEQIVLYGPLKPVLDRS